MMSEGHRHDEAIDEADATDGSTSTMKAKNGRPDRCRTVCSGRTPCRRNRGLAHRFSPSAQLPPLLVLSLRGSSRRSPQIAT